MWTLFSLLSFHGLYLCLSMLLTEFIPIPCSYSTENEYNGVPSINLEHVLPKKNFKNKLAVTQIYLEQYFCENLYRTLPWISPLKLQVRCPHLFFLALFLKGMGYGYFYYQINFYLDIRTSTMSLHHDFLSSKNLGCQHSPDSEPCCVCVTCHFLTWAK